jgi:hypothetical protein
MPLPFTNGADVIFGINNTLHTFEGFGTQIWANQSHGIAEFGNLNIKYIRITKDGSSWTQMSTLRSTTDALGIEWLYNIWSAPAYDTNSDGMLDDVSGFAIYWKDLVNTLDYYGVRPHYIDLMNEPDSGGGWSTGISPTNYNAAVKQVRIELDNAGFTDVGIAGPGVTHLDWNSHNSQWIGALDSTAVSNLAVWASHSWDDGDTCRSDGYSDNYSGGENCIEAHWPDYGDSADAKDPGKSKWITEYATKEYRFHGLTYPRPDDTGGYSAAFSMAYAVRVYENTLALLNNGASVLLYWSAQDGGKSWGYVDASGNKKCVYYTLSTLFPEIPVGASVINITQQDSTIYAGAYIYNDRLVIGLVNDSTTERSTTVRIQGAPGINIVQAPACIIDHVGDPVTEDPDTAQIVYRSLTVNPDNSIDVTLPGDSTLTIVCDIVTTGDMDGSKFIDSRDFVLFGLQWLDTGCGDCSGADFSGDGDVSSDDLEFLAQSWLTDFSLESYFKLDGDATDSSWYGHTVELKGDPVWTDGKLGGAIELDGAGDFFRTPDYFGVLGAGARTCSAWVRTSQLTGNIIGWGNPDIDSGKWVMLVRDDGGEGHLRISIGNGWIMGSTNIADGVWHHVAAVFANDGTPDISEARLYVDGVEEVATYSSYPVNTMLAKNVRVGYYVSNYFTGKIDDVRIYDRALSEAEIQALAAMSD